MYKHIALVFLLGLAFGCGREADSELDSVASEEPRLRFAELTQADAREQPQSYLVAFRQILSDERLHFASFTTAVQAHNQALGANFGRFGHSDKIRYLASLNLSDLAHSFQAVLNWNNPALLQANLPVVSNIASLVEVNFADDAEARSTLKAWLASGRIWFAEPNGKSQLAGPLESKIIDGFKDNQQNTPWLDEVSFIPAIQQMAALSSIAEPLIAVMDSGVDVMHPNLRDAIYINDQAFFPLEPRVLMSVVMAMNSVNMEPMSRGLSQHGMPLVILECVPTARFWWLKSLKLINLPARMPSPLKIPLS
ncbi:MAG: hypothetical protein NTX25_07100 [Proteobacteria bacterium]|nr:hypothetical protein [Pseudomonadota bacterium]